MATEIFTYQQELGEDQSATIKVFCPETEVPKEGFPVIFILDGSAYFSMFCDLISLQSRRTEKTGVPAAIVVGICAEGEAPFPKRRIYDFTPNINPCIWPEKPDGTDWPEHGGADYTIKLLKDVKKEVNARYKINFNESILFGHSLGGLFTSYVLLNDADLFSHYYIASPSLWWNQQWLLKQKFNLTKSSQKVYIAVEQQDKHDMHDLAYKYYQKLLAHYVETVFDNPQDENHMSIVPTTMSRALRFLWKDVEH